jgi:hypothetical protein
LKGGQVESRVVDDEKEAESEEDDKWADEWRARANKDDVDERQRRSRMSWEEQ